MQSSRNNLRADFPTLPDRIKDLPVSDNGYPIPFFVSYIDGKPDFRVVDSEKLKSCVKGGLCWICGQKLGRHKAFSGGPMLSVSKVSVEPPSHRDCAVFAAQTCPFMVLPKSKRREANLPTDVSVMGGEDNLTHNPGATLVWITSTYDLIASEEGQRYFKIGEPSEVIWYAEGQIAPREMSLKALQGSVEAAFERYSGQPPEQIKKLVDASIAAQHYLPS